MTVIIVFALIAIGLFVAALVTKRRFGLLGLALAAGSTLSGIWDYTAGLIVSSTGLVPEGPLTNAVTLSLIVLLPAILLLFHGYAYKSTFGRVVGALLFTLLALAFLVEPLGFALPLDSTGAEIYGWIKQNKDTIIGFGLVAAIIDLFFTKPTHLAEKAGKGSKH